MYEHFTRPVLCSESKWDVKHRDKYDEIQVTQNEQ